MRVGLGYLRGRRCHISRYHICKGAYIGGGAHICLALSKSHLLVNYGETVLAVPVDEVGVVVLDRLVEGVGAGMHAAYPLLEPPLEVLLKHFLCLFAVAVAGLEKILGGLCDDEPGGGIRDLFR